MEMQAGLEGGDGHGCLSVGLDWVKESVSTVRWLASMRVLRPLRFQPQGRARLHSPNLLLERPEPPRAPGLGKALVLELRCLGPAQNTPPRVLERALWIASG